MAGPDTQQREALRTFISEQRFAVVATVSDGGRPEAALVGIAVTPDLEIVFETTDATRKLTNLRRDPHIALVIGWADQRTLQFEGIADEPEGKELERLKEVFFKARPDLQNHEVWPGLAYVRVRPNWIRFSSYYRPRSVEEVTFEIAKQSSRAKSGFLKTLRARLGIANEGHG